MKITVKLEIEKETGEVYRVESEGSFTEEAGTLIARFGHDVGGISIKNSLPEAVINALRLLPGAWMPTDLDRFAASSSAGEIMVDTFPNGGKTTVRATDPKTGMACVATNRKDALDGLDLLMRKTRELEEAGVSPILKSTISREEIERMIAELIKNYAASPEFIAIVRGIAEGCGDIHEAKKHMSDAVYGPVKSFEEPADMAEIGRAVTDAIGDGRNFGVQPSADDAPADRLSEIEQKRVLTVRKYVEHSNLSQAYIAELRKGVRYVGGVGWTPKEAAAHLFIDLLEHERVFADMTGIEYVEETDE